MTGSYINFCVYVSCPFLSLSLSFHLNLLYASVCLCLSVCLSLPLLSLFLSFFLNQFFFFFLIVSNALYGPFRQFCVLASLPPCVLIKLLWHRPSVPAAIRFFLSYFFEDRTEKKSRCPPPLFLVKGAAITVLFLLPVFV